MRIAILMALALTGCGAAEFGGKNKDKDEGAEAAAPHSMLVQDASKLPPCDAAGEGWLVYLKTEAKLKVCSAGVWTDVVVPQARIIGTLACGGVLEAPISFFYAASLLSSGDVFASAEIFTPAVGTSSSAYFSAQQNGSDTGRVSLVFDLVGDSNLGRWSVSVERKSLVTTVLYEDPDTAGGSRTWSMTPDKCVINDFSKAP